MAHTNRPGLRNCSLLQFSMQNLCVPPWVVRGALDDYQTVINTHQTRIVQKNCPVWCKWSSSFWSTTSQLDFNYRGSDKLVPFAQRMLWNRHLIFFSLSIMIYHKTYLPDANTFWPMWIWQYLLAHVHHMNEPGLHGSQRVSKLLRL